MEQKQTEKQWDHKNGVWVGNSALDHKEEFKIPSPLWIFGYGSLCYKNSEMECDKVIDCKVNGYIRRFWQKSMDHRGTPETPGYVCTLISAEEIEELKKKNEYDSSLLCRNEKNEEILEVQGRAFRIKESAVQQVLDTLDFREKGGYTRDLVQINYKGKIIEALLYKGTIENPAFEMDFEKRNSVKKQAEIIYKTVGPSGPNIDYFNNLYKYLESQKALDKYMIELNKEIQNIQQQEQR